MKALHRRADSPGRGRHLLAARSIRKGELIFVEKPLLSLQTVGNAHTGALVCRYCRAFVGGPRLCLQIASGSLTRDTLGKTVIQGQGDLNNGLGSCPYLVPCRHGCGEIFCSYECESSLWEYGGHELLCTGLIPDSPALQNSDWLSSCEINQGDEGSDEEPEMTMQDQDYDTLHPLLKFKLHAIRNNEIFLLVGDLVATVISLHRKQLELRHIGNRDDCSCIALSDMLAPYLDFTLNPWWEVATASLIASPLGFVEAKQLDKTLRSLCQESSALLKEAFVELTNHPSSSSNTSPDPNNRKREIFCYTLAQAIKDCDELLSEIFFGKIIGSFEQNAIGIRARHPLCRDILEYETLRKQLHIEIVACLHHGGLLESDDEMDTESTTAAEKSYTTEKVDQILSDLYIEEEGCGLHKNKAQTVVDGADDMDDSEGDDLDILFPPLDGTAMYQNACKMNHSCDPNVIVRYSYSRTPGGLIGKNRWGQNSPLLLECIAQRDIEEDEELCISYVNSSGTVQQRQDELLFTYGFQCNCPKCICELKSIAFCSSVRLDDQQIFEDDEMEYHVSEKQLQSGETIYPILRKLDTSLACNSLAILPMPIFSTVLTFIIQHGSELIQRSMNGDAANGSKITQEISTNIQQCMVAVGGRDFGVCIEIATRCEQQELEFLLTMGRWRSAFSQSAYLIYALTAAVAYAQGLKFNAAMALLDKAFIVGLHRPALKSFFDYVSYHADCAFRSHARHVYLQIIGCMDLLDDEPDLSSVSIKNPIRENAVNGSDILDEVIRNRKPCIIRNFAAFWPGTAKWRGFTMFASDHGHRIIPIEVGDMTNGMKERLITFSSFYHQYLHDDGSNKCVAYLAQHSLTDQIPSLLQDIQLHPNMSTLMEGETKINVWIGTKGTRTPLHYDSMDNVFVQICGYKYVRLYSAEETDKLYVMSNCTYGKQGNMSAIDCEREDFLQHPLAANVQYEDAVLGPGDVLFIPSYEWHYVRGLTRSASVNYWF